MDDLRTLLAAVVLGDRATAERAAQALSAGARWPAAVAMAAAWRVVPALRRRTGELGAGLDAESARDLGVRSRAAAMQATAVAHRAAAVLAALRTAGVPAVPFKGVGVIASLYRGAGQRMVQDMDILVAAPHVAAAADVFRGLGFAPITDRFAEYMEYLRDRPREGAFAGNQYLIFTDVDRLEIDLHWQLGVRPPPALDAAGIIARAEPARLFGVDISAPAPPDAMLLTAHHVLRDGFAPATAIKDLCDLAAWWWEPSGRWTVAEVTAHARAAGLTVPLLALWKILASFDTTAALVEGTAALAGVCNAAERADAERLAQVFHWQLRHGQLNGDVLQLLSPLVVLRFLVRRLRRRRTLEYFDERIESELGLPPPPSYGIRVTRLLRDLCRLERSVLTGYRALLRAQRDSHPPH